MLPTLPSVINRNHGSDDFLTAPHGSMYSGIELPTRTSSRFPAASHFAMVGPRARCASMSSSQDAWFDLWMHMVGQAFNGMVSSPFTIAYVVVSRTAPTILSQFLRASNMIITR